MPNFTITAEPLAPALDTYGVAEVLNCGSRTVEKMARDGRLKAFKLGGHWRYRREDVEAFMRGEQPKARRSSRSRTA